MWILFYIVIGVFSVIGFGFSVLMLLPIESSLKINKFQTMEFEIETNQGIYRGKIRYRTFK